MAEKKSRSDVPGPEVVESEDIRVNRVGVKLRGAECEKLENGEWVVWVKAQPLTESHRETLRQLYPNLGELAYDLLNKEALLASMV